MRAIGWLAARCGQTGPAPIAIVGTGRCGSTLLVRILESHPEIAAWPGEANELWHPNSYPWAQRAIDTPPMVESRSRPSMLLGRPRSSG